MASFLNDTNVSYYTIPVALGLALYPRVYAGLSGPGKKYFTPQNPRAFVDNLEKTEALDKKLRLRLIRAEACGANAFENLPLFAAAVTAGNAAGLSVQALNYLSVGYIVSRIAYTWVYIFGLGDRNVHPLARTAVWSAAIGCVMTLFVKAGLKLQP
ncbi:uncharacterized protein JN550_007750 [Neoarthrinium moseri]|uniref:uncharacterized protein n=1 Tax=Neoarthrinium moseri TaxID=1658444 RepID=UPI001FDE9749|nr:uncharacterized protein JN550_007750 [Neoarthrinium moseri]KAI1866362.1 hypothetical protein JN550_007750 [Neoarthrinium moseri]